MIIGPASPSPSLRTARPIACRLVALPRPRAVVHLTRASASGYDGRVIARRVGARKFLQA